MGRRSNLWRPPLPLSLARQCEAMRSDFPAFTARWHHDQLCWRGNVQPSKVSATYQIQISYRLGDMPRVRVLSPPLVSRPDGTPPPHRYPSGALCLFYPPAREWHARHLISRTILPWISLWLFHYECWLSTGEWEGGGIVHSARRMQRARRGSPASSVQEPIA